MNDKQFTVEDVLRQAVVRQMMDAGALTNHPPSKREIYEKEELNEVPKVQPHDHGK